MIHRGTVVRVCVQESHNGGIIELVGPGLTEKTSDLGAVIGGHANWGIIQDHMIV